MTPLSPPSFVRSLPEMTPRHRAGASGSIYDYANLGNNTCSHFDINPMTGDWYLNGGAPAINKAEPKGTSMGPNGEYIGGTWGMYNNSNDGAVGVFQGSR